MKRIRSVIPAMIILALLCTGCPHPLWLPDRNLKALVQEQDVIGTWNLRPESLALLTRDSFKTNASHHYQIHFMTNGVCSFQTVAETFPGATYHDVKGGWKLEHNTTGDSNIKKKNAIKLELSLPTMTRTCYLNFDMRDSALILWNFYGDPDSWEFMEYTKAQ